MELMSKSTKNQLCQVCQYFAKQLANKLKIQNIEIQHIMTFNTSTLPSLPLFRPICANVFGRLPLCHTYKINNKHYYYIDIWQSMYQLFTTILGIFIGKFIGIERYINLYRYGKPGKVGKLRLCANAVLILERKYRWQTYGKVGKPGKLK